MKTNHTPGPWSVKSPDEISVSAGLEGRVAILSNLRGPLGMQGRRNPDEVMANARLIAAAPDLLSALQAMLTHMGMDEDEWNKPTFDQARRAIAKATGEQS